MNGQETPVRVTDEQALTLRTFLEFDPGYVRLATQLAGREQGLPGFGELVHAAFVIAVRNRFGPTWTSAEVINLVADMRIGLRLCAVDVVPGTAEVLIRQALGDSATITVGNEIRAQVWLLVLGHLISSAIPETPLLEPFLAGARELADRWLTERSFAQ